MPTTKEAMEALEMLIEGADECYEQRGDLDQPRATLRQFIEEAKGTIDRLTEALACYPGKPDWVGQMIGARFRNLEAAAKTNEDAWRHAQATADAAGLDAERYRYLRGGKARKPSSAKSEGLIEVYQWQDRSEGRVLKGEALDAAVDAALAARASQPGQEG